MRTENSSRDDLRFAIIVWLILLSILAVLVIVAWENHYRFHERQLADGESYQLRTNRLTGKTEVLDQGQWKSASILPSLTKAIESLPAADIQKLTAMVDPKFKHTYDEDFGEDVSFYLELYNGSNFILKEITVEIIVKDSHGDQVLRRVYPFSQRQEPGEKRSYFQSLDFRVGPGQSWSWRLVGAKGIKL